METFWGYVGNALGLTILIGAAVWVFLDAKAIGDDQGRHPGIVSTKPGYWATGIVLALIFVLPVYLLMRIRYKRLLAERKAQAALDSPQDQETSADTAGVWPPPPAP
jgi:hypothetical protein